MGEINRIKLVLFEKMRTARWLAGEMGVSAVTVSKWCTNMHQPSLPQLTEIEGILDVDVSTLIGTNK